MSYNITATPTLTPGEPKTTPILNFLSSFYQTSDTESQHETYVSSFTHDATLIMGSRKAVGTDGIFPSPSPYPYPIYGYSFGFELMLKKGM